MAKLLHPSLQRHEVYVIRMPVCRTSREMTFTHDLGDHDLFFWWPWSMTFDLGDLYGQAFLIVNLILMTLTYDRVPSGWRLHGVAEKRGRIIINIKSLISWVHLHTISLNFPIICNENKMLQTFSFSAVSLWNSANFDRWTISVGRVVPEIPLSLSPLTYQILTGFTLISMTT